ncbi:MAG: hypothetical protein ACMUEM_05475 [Flavobacteriales bacterium AspAUS03]
MKNHMKGSDKKNFLGMPMNGAVSLISFLVTFTFFMGDDLKEWFSRIQKIVTNNIG